MGSSTSRTTSRSSSGLLRTKSKRSPPGQYSITRLKAWEGTRGSCHGEAGSCSSALSARAGDSPCHPPRNRTGRRCADETGSSAARSRARPVQDKWNGQKPVCMACLMLFETRHAASSIPHLAFGQRGQVTLHIPLDHHLDRIAVCNKDDARLCLGKHALEFCRGKSSQK